MKKTLVLLLTIFLSTATAKPARKIAQVDSETPQATVFAGFLGCRALLVKGAATELDSCITPYAVEAAARKRSFLRFLASPVDISRIRDCRAEDLARAKGFPDTTDHVVCFDYDDGIHKGVGLAYFLKHAGKLKVFSLQSLPNL